LGFGKDKGKKPHRGLIILQGFPIKIENKEAIPSPKNDI
jgi:hypothetical protein